MDSIPLTPYQIELIERPLGSRLFLEGQAGSGKTTVGIGRMLALLNTGVPASTLLLLVPQRTLAAPYQAALRDTGMAPGGQVSVLTVGGLARRMVDLFWPLIAEDAGFARPDLPPAFLTLETSLYYMAHLVHPLLEQGLFDSVTIDRNRVYSQILDNLNKAAIVGFPYTDIGERLKAGWPADTAQVHVYEDAQRCATLFREYCLQNNLLDFSLQIEIFCRHLWPSMICRAYLRSAYRHVIADNIEEDNPIAHDLLREWLPEFDSALLIYDQDAGYRRFLGADPDTAYALLDQCDEHHVFTETLVTAPALRSFCRQMGQAMERGIPVEIPSSRPAERLEAPPVQSIRETPLRSEQLAAALDFPDRVLRFYPQMLDWVVGQVEALIRQGTPPGEIVLLAPLLPDSLRFALSSRLAARGIPYRSHRPSRSLREEPVTQALITLAEIAHPGWGFRPSNFEVAYALIQTIDGMDLVRSQMLVESAYRTSGGLPTLLPFDRIRAETQERITYLAGTRYETLRRWLEAYAAGAQPDAPAASSGDIAASRSAIDGSSSAEARLAVPAASSSAIAGSSGAEARLAVPYTELDYFFSRLFGEVLSQPGFAFHANYEAGTVCANLIESAQKFRWAVENRTPAPDHPEEDADCFAARSLGKEYIRMIQDGVLAAQYIQSWQIPDEDAVLIAPAYTFLLANRPVDHQFWLDVGSSAWSERLYQPLTHPYILSREWDRNRIWTDVDEYERNLDALYRLVLGLVRRCRKRVHLGLCDLSESGYESRGMLLRAIQVVMQQSRGYQTIGRQGGGTG